MATYVQNMSRFISITASTRVVIISKVTSVCYASDNGEVSPVGAARLKDIWEVIDADFHKRLVDSKLLDERSTFRVYQTNQILSVVLLL